MARPSRGRLTPIVVLLALAMAALTACAGAPPARRARFMGPPDMSNVQTGGDDLTPDPGGSASPSAPVPSGAALAARIPKFPPAPQPQPIAVPAGPSVPIYKRLPVNQPVAFLTIDDGWFQLPDDPRLMRAAHIPFTMFLISAVAAKNPGFFKELEAAGGVIEDHTVTHPSLKGAAYGFQHHEVCDGRTSLEQTFGRTPQLFRPPFGNYDQTTLRVVHDCGLKAAFYWSETVNYGVVAYQTAEHRIQPGDIILMHFRPAFVNDVIAALVAIHQAGLTPALLEDYIA